MCSATAESSLGPGHPQIVPHHRRRATVMCVSCFGCVWYDGLLFFCFFFWLAFAAFSDLHFCFVCVNVSRVCVACAQRFAGSVAQMVERSLRMRQVQGSMPCTSKLAGNFHHTRAMFARLLGERRRGGSRYTEKEGEPRRRPAVFAHIRPKRHTCLCTTSRNGGRGEIPPACPVAGVLR